MKIISSTVLSAPFEKYDEEITDYYMIKKLSNLAYEKAGIGPEDLDLVEMHDAFAEEELIAYEAMGLCPPGDCVAFARSGQAEIGGKCAVSPSGGLQSLGHPLGASGARVVCEVTQHLLNEAGDRQVKGAKVGMAQMIGGYLTGLGSPDIGAVKYSGNIKDQHLT